MNLSRNQYLFLGLAVIVFPYLIWLVIGESSYIRNYDTLDSEIVYIKHLLDINPLSLELHSQIEAVMTGLSRSFFRSGYNLTLLIFWLIPMPFSYIFNHFIIHMIGFIGMFLLCERYLLKNQPALVLLISLTFAFVDYHHVQLGISVSGQPLLLFAFLNIIRGKNNYYNWVIILLFPLCSIMVYTVPFYLPFLLGILFWEIRKGNNKTWNLNFFYALLLFLLLSIAVEFQLIYSTLFNSESISHRIEIDIFKWIYGNPSLVKSAKTIISKLAISGGDFAGRILTLPIIFLLIAAFIKSSKRNKELVMTVSLTLLITAYTGFYNMVLYHVRDIIPLLKLLNLNRYMFLLPFLWMVILSLISSDWIESRKWRLAVYAVTLITLGSTLFFNHELKQNLKLLVGLSITEPTFEQFYETDLFDQMKKDHEEIQDERIISVGLYPAISQYNDLKSLDGFQNNYELSYKKKFRVIIAEELLKNEVNRKNFDYWGNRCRIFPDELNSKKLVSKSDALTIDELSIDTNQIKKMGGGFVISAVKIMNSKELNLQFLSHYVDNDSFYEIFLYEIMD